jgi:hypothetical protein
MMRGKNPNNQSRSAAALEFLFADATLTRSGRGD